MKPALRAFAVLLVVAVGAWFRARHAAHHGLWLDEFGTVWASRGDTAGESMRRVFAIHGQSPLYYLIVRATTHLLGETETTVRLPALVCGSLVPLFAYLGAAKAWGRRAGAAAMLVLALHPGPEGIVDQSQTSRPYPLAQLGVAIAFVGLAHALASGSGRARFATWAGGILAVYAMVLPALGLAPLIARRAYRTRDVLLDGVLAFAALTPILGHVARVFARRADLAWVPALESWVIGRLAYEEERFVLFGALVAVAVMHDLGVPLRRALGIGVSGGGALAFAGSLAGGTLAALLALFATGTNIIAERYLTPGILASQLLVGWAVARHPRWLGAAALVWLAVVSGQQQPANYGQEWREAANTMEQLARPGEPVLLWPCFVEANLLVRPNAVDADRRAFLVSSMETRLGGPDRGRSYVLVPSTWDLKGRGDYYERAVVPRLEPARSFVVVAHPSFVPLFEEWLAKRLPGRFHATTRSREFAGPLVVVRFEG